MYERHAQKETNATNTHFGENVSNDAALMIFCNVRQRWPGHRVIEVYPGSLFEAISRLG